MYLGPLQQEQGFVCGFGERYAGLPIVYAGSVVIGPTTRMTANMLVKPQFHRVHTLYPIPLTICDYGGPMRCGNILERVIIRKIKTSWHKNIYAGLLAAATLVSRFCAVCFALKI